MITPGKIVPKPKGNSAWIIPKQPRTNPTEQFYPITLTLSKNDSNPFEVFIVPHPKQYFDHPKQNQTVALGYDSRIKVETFN